MKKFFGFLIATMLLILPCSVMANEYDTSLEALFQTEKIEVGDQFLVNIKKSDSDLKFLTFRIKGSFDSKTAQIVAPVYTNSKLGVLTNKFDNENGTFLFEGYDTTIRGTEEDIICSILFEATETGEFEIELEEGCMLGKYNENAFYSLELKGNKATVTEDTDGENIKLIEDEEPQTPYDELIMGHPDEKGITVMYKLGVLKDIAEETIDTEKSVTRGEFGAMLQRVCKLKSSAAVENFEDIDTDSFVYEPVKILKAKGIAKGDGEKIFAPNENITRQDAFTLIFRTMVSMNKVDEKIDSEAYLSVFEDKEEIAPYATDAVAAMMRAKLWGEDATNCEPEREMALGEVCGILNQLAEFNILVSRN